MKIPFSRARANFSAARGCLVLGVVGSFTAGCVRELTDLTFAAQPADDASVLDAAVLEATVDAASGEDSEASARVLDASIFDAATPVTTASPLDAASSVDLLDASAPTESRGPDAATPNEAGPVSSSDALSQGTDAGGHAGAVDAGERGERWPFAVAQTFSPSDSGLGVVPLFPSVGVVVDGSSSEWSDEGWVWIATPDMSIGQPLSANDLSAAFAVRWQSSKFFVVVAVMDERHVNDSGGFEIWGGDSIQIAFDTGQGRLPYDWEYGFAKTSQGLIAHRWREGDADLSDMEFAVVRNRAMTVYEVAFEPRHLGVQAFPADVLRLSIAVNDNDGQERSAALELVQGIVGTKSSDQFASAEWKQ